MDTKLTLKLDQDVIADAKRYAKKKNISLSKMVERYFKSLVGEKAGTENVTALVNELSGIIRLDEDYDFKEDYSGYLVEKYK